jgi:hypothetical protein
MELCVSDVDTTPSSTAVNAQVALTGRPGGGRFSRSRTARASPSRRRVDARWRSEAGPNVARLQMCIGRTAEWRVG